MNMGTIGASMNTQEAGMFKPSEIGLGVNVEQGSHQKLYRANV